MRSAFAAGRTPADDRAGALDRPEGAGTVTIDLSTRNELPDRMPVGLERTQASTGHAT